MRVEVDDDGRHREPARDAASLEPAYDDEGAAHASGRHSLIDEELRETEPDEAHERGSLARTAEDELPAPPVDDVGEELQHDAGDEPGRGDAPCELEELALLGEVRGDRHDGGDEREPDEPADDARRATAAVLAQLVRGRVGHAPVRSRTMPAWLSLVAALVMGCAEEPLPPPSHPYPLPDPRPATSADEGREVAVGVDDDAYADTDPSALSDFRTPLEGHGTWSEDPTYGTVWTPSRDEVGPDFTPYVTAGHWAYDDEWVWVSDWSWGWVPFHYGRWVLVAGRGWCWVPGRLYSGAWVVWRTGDDGYGWVGWAPMPPVWIWRGGVAVGLGFAPPPPRFVVVPRVHVFAPSLVPHVVLGERARPILRETHPFVHPGRVVPPSHPIPQPPHLGPPPSSLHVDPPRVLATPGVGRAREIAKPRTAEAAGAKPPTPHVVRPKVQAPVGRSAPATKPRR